MTNPPDPGDAPQGTPPYGGQPGYYQPGYGQPGGWEQQPPAGWGPPPSALSPQEERTWAMLAHLGALIAGFLALAFLGPLIVMLTQGTKSAFVRRHAVESLNFQLTLLIAFVAGIVLSIVTLGLGLFIFVPAAIVIGIAALVLIIMASVKANNGEDYRYPLTIRLVK